MGKLRLAGRMTDVLLAGWLGQASAGKALN
jgi:hypothetical protein